MLWEIWQNEELHFTADFFSDAGGGKNLAQWLQAWAAFFLDLTTYWGQAAEFMDGVQVSINDGTPIAGWFMIKKTFKKHWCGRGSPHLWTPSFVFCYQDPTRPSTDPTKWPETTWVTRTQLSWGLVGVMASKGAMEINGMGMVCHHHLGHPTLWIC